MKIIMYGFGTASMAFYLYCLGEIYQHEDLRAIALGVVSIVSFMFMKLSYEGYKKSHD